MNFVDNLDIVQQFEQMPDGNWVLTDDDMTVELQFVKGIQGLEAVSYTHLYDSDDNLSERMEGSHYGLERNQSHHSPPTKKHAQSIALGYKY